MSFFSSRPLRVILKILAAFIVLAVIMGGLFIWRLSRSPISTSFFTPYLEKAIEARAPGTDAHIAHSLLTWDNADHTIALHAEGIRVAGRNDKPIAEIPAVDVRVNALGLLVGRLMPSGLRLDNAKLWMERNKDGVFLFGGIPAGGEKDDDARHTLKDLTDGLARAHLMRKLDVKNALVTIRDEETGRDWTVAMPEASLVRRHGGALDGNARMEVVDNSHTALLVAHYAYDPDLERHQLTVRASGINPSRFGSAGTGLAAADLPLTGEINILLDDMLNPLKANVDLHADGGTLAYADFWNEPRPVKSVDLKGEYDGKTGKLNIGRADIDFGGPLLKMTLQGAPPAAGVSPPRDLEFELALTLANLPMDEFASVWPKTIIPNPREWIAKNLSKGNFDKGEAGFKGALAWNDLANIAFTEGKGRVQASNGTVKYMDGMPRVEGVNADADFTLDNMTVKVSGGGIGDLRLQPSTIILTDFQKHVQYIDLPVRIAGPVSSVLRLIDAPPLGYAKSVGLDPASVTGRLDGTLFMKFPLLDKLLLKDADIRARANITDLVSKKLVPGLDITNGTFALDLDKDGFKLEGDASIRKVPLHAIWKQSFSDKPGKPLQQATITGQVAGGQWGQLGISPLADSKGPIGVTLEMLQMKKDLTTLSGALDMKAAEMQVEEIGWKKAAGEPASLSFVADMPAAKKNVVVKSIQAEGPNLKIKGSAELSAGDFNPVALAFDPFVTNRINARLRYSQVSAGKKLFLIEGESFDISGLRNMKSSGGPPTPGQQEFKIKLDKLFTSEYGLITQAEGNAVRDEKGWLAINLGGLADAKHKFDITLTPRPDGHSDFYANADDFGAMLKGFGLTDQVYGGKLRITGASTPEEPRAIAGKIKIGSFEVKNLPVLVMLVNATSPFGIIDLFKGSLGFDHLYGRYRWTNEAIQFDNVRAAGNSVGMTINGKRGLE
ncbi:MAG: DUF3971 domain-containing protein, partial [Bdellovibrionales bacterium]